MKAGEGDASAINDVLNFFTTPTTNEITYVNSAGAEVTETVNGSPLESTGAKIILGGITSTSYESGAYSLESIVSSAKRTVLVGGATSVTCSGVQAASSIVSLVATGIPGGTIAKVIIGAVAETVGGIVITAALGAVISAITPTLARVLFTNVMEAYTGIPGGEFFSQGLAASNGKNAAASGYVPGDTTQTTTNARAAANVIAQEAKIDRLNRSPFDISSKNTFLGSIVSGLLPLYTTSSATSTLSAINSIAGNAASNLLPSSFAASTASTYHTIYGDCPSLEEIGVKGDIYCNAIPTTDLSIIDIEPDDLNYETAIMRNMSSDGSTIKDNSELAKFINFCANRESPYGVTDANILNALQSDAGVILNNVPILNDVIDIINATEDIANQGWATGAVCANSTNNPRWNSEFKYYQRYIEDTRILDQMGAYEDDQNPVIAYQEKYYSEHPLDNSTEGYLARITGMTTNDIAFLLEFSSYSDFLANYDPSALYPVLTETLDHPKLTISLASSFIIEQGIIPNIIAYADVRNKNFAI